MRDRYVWQCFLSSGVDSTHICLMPLTHCAFFRKQNFFLPKFYFLKFCIVLVQAASQQSRNAATITTCWTGSFSKLMLAEFLHDQLSTVCQGFCCFSSNRVLCSVRFSRHVRFARNIQARENLLRKPYRAKFTLIISPSRCK